MKRDADGRATLGGIALGELRAAHDVETPAYVYDLDAIARDTRELDEAFGSRRRLIAYAVKANSAGAIVGTIVGCGAGCEVVSGGELGLVRAAACDPERVLYSGVAKLDREIDDAIGYGERGIRAIQVESVEEIGRVDARAKALGRKARVSIRVNPGVEADTHAHVATGHDDAKFGVALEDVGDAWEAIARASSIDLVGVSTHVGSQLTDLDDYLAAARALIDIAKARTAQGTHFDFLDFGGGFGVDYGAGCAVRPADFARAICDLTAKEGLADVTLVVEPGRSLVASHGVILASVVGAKRSKTGRRWLMIDAGMNDLVRPALYGARHRIESIDAPPSSRAISFRVVGPVCESSDDFGEHPFDEPLPTHVVVRDAGAYGFTMASEYNARPLPSEIFLSGGAVVAKTTPSSDRLRAIAAWQSERMSSLAALRAR